MKNLVLLSILMLTTPSLYSQSVSEKKEKFNKQLKFVIDDYKYNNDNSFVIQEELLNNRLSKAFNQVVFSSTDLVDNASAFGYTQNEEKTNVSVGTNFRLFGKSKHQFYMKAGLNANGSGSIFNVYSGEEWISSVGGKFGLIWKFRGSGISNLTKNTFEKDKVLREIFIRDSLMTDLVSFKKGGYKIEIDAYKMALSDKDEDAIKEHSKNLKLIESFFKKLQDKDVENSDKLDFSDYSKSSNNEKIIDEIIEGLWKKDETKYNKALRDVLKEIAYEYDKENVNNTGYSFWWFDTDLGLTNNTFNFSEKAKNIESDVLESFNALDAQKTGIDKLGVVISGNLNYSRNWSNGAYFVQGGAKFNSGSFLNSNLIDGTPKITNVDAEGLFTIEDESNQVLGDFSSIRNNLQFGSFDIYGAYFIGKKKTFGVNIAYSHRYNIRIPENTSYENNYSILFGPIFRKPGKEDTTDLTFSLDVGFDNAVYDTRANDDFVARIRIGIPI